MSIEKVNTYFDQLGLTNYVTEHDSIGDTVAHAAQILGCKEQQIAKSMTFIVNDSPILIVMAGDAKADNKKFKARFNIKPSMVPFDQVESLIGHVPGGVTPFAVNDPVQVFLDESLKRFDTVYTSGGSTNSTIKLTLAELEQYSNPVDWVDVGKNWA